MKVIYDQKTGILTIILTETSVTENDKNRSGVILDYDDKGNLVSLEILNASRWVNVLSRIQYQDSPVKRWVTPAVTREYIRSLRGKYKGKGVMKALMAERRRGREL